MAKFIEPSQVRERWTKNSKATRKQVNDYWMNSLFLADEQWVAQNKVTGGIDEIPRLDPERVQLTVNLLRPRTRGILSKLIARPLMFQVPPRSADDVAVLGAQKALEVLEWYYDEHDWEALREDQAHTTWIGGTAGLCLEWDPTAGTKLVDPKTNGPVSSVDGKRALFTGDLCASVLSLPEMAFEAGTRNGETALHWMKCTALPPETVKEMFGLDETPKPDAGPMVSPVQWRMLSTQDQGSVDQQLTAVYTYFERPNRGSDRGQVVVVVGDERVQEGEWPFPFTDRLNVVLTRETFVHGRWFGDTVLTSARVPQMAVNQAHSSIVEHIKRASNARTWVNQATIDLVEELTDEPGEFAAYVGPEKPTQLGATQQPSWWIEQPSRMTAVVDEILGSAEVSRGVAPRNVESGLGLSLLSENANTPLGQMAKETARAWSKFATMALETLEVKVTEQRDGYFSEMPDYALPAQKFSWTGKDFSGQTKANVPLDSLMPRSPAQTQAWAQAQFDRGVIDVRQYARIVQMPEQEHMLEIADPDASKAEYENYRMAQGLTEIPAVFDDHKKHIAVVNAHRKSRRYSSYDDATKKLFDDHAAAHEQYALDEAAKQAGRAAIDPSAALAATANEAPGSLPAEDPRAAQDQPPQPGGTPPAQPDAAMADTGEPIA